MLHGRSGSLFFVRSPPHPREGGPEVPGRASTRAPKIVTRAILISSAVRTPRWNARAAAASGPPFYPDSVFDPHHPESLKSNPSAFYGVDKNVTMMYPSSHELEQVDAPPPALGPPPLRGRRPLRAFMILFLLGCAAGAAAVVLVIAVIVIRESYD